VLLVSPEPTVLQSVTVQVGAPWITCVNAVCRILGYAFVPHISHVRRLLLVLPRPSRRCQTSDRGRRVRARDATAQRLGLDSADAVEIIRSEEDEPQLGRLRLLPLRTAKAHVKWWLGHRGGRESAY
jgi:hypothetical protein